MACSLSMQKVLPVNYRKGECRAGSTFKGADRAPGPGSMEKLSEKLRFPVNLPLGPSFTSQILRAFFKKNHEGA